MPKAPLTHLICVQEGDETGYSMTSPQLPGLVFARHTLDEFNEDLPKVLLADGVELRRAIMHNQQRLAKDDGTEYLVRVAVDSEQEARLQLAQRVVQTVAEDSNFTQDLAVNAVGEVTFVCCVRSDTVGWIIDQMDQRNDAVQMTVALDDDYVFASQFASGSRIEDWPKMSDRGWTRDTTVGQLLDQMLHSESRKALPVLV